MRTTEVNNEYNEKNIRVVANRFQRKYAGLNKQHVYWIAKQLGIYPDGIPHKRKSYVAESKTGRINRDNVEYVTNGKLNEKAISAIENILIQEGYVISKDYKEGAMMDTTSIWQQADLISMMKKDYEKAIADRDAAKAEAEQYCAMVDEYEKEIENLKDKLIIAEKENNSLKSEKKELSQMQIKTIDFSKEIDSLQARIGKMNADINYQISDLNELRKEFSAMQTSMNHMQENKKKLDGVMNDLIGCSKRLMNMK